MTRILLTLGLLSLLVMGVTLCLGLAIGDLYAEPSQQTLRLATAHRLAGPAAALMVVFVESIVVTYFIGTSRWCREVVQTYQLDPAPAEASQRLKRRAFPLALAGMLVVVAVGALGAASDPATGRPGTHDWVKIHLVAAISGFGFIAWTYYMAWNYIASNHAIIGQIVAEVARVRRERGLDLGENS